MRYAGLVPRNFCDRCVLALALPGNSLLYVIPLRQPLPAVQRRSRQERTSKTAHSLMPQKRC